DGSISSGVMGVLLILGAWRNFDRRIVRLSLFIVLIALVVFRAADFVHPIISDYTLHWCFTFTALLAGAGVSARALDRHV
ncbi:hypothetical protein ABTL47_19925, partial [Acinetobacter baumannii]